MLDQFKHFRSLFIQALNGPLFDYVASLTLSTLLGTIPLFLLLIFCIYHTPYLNMHQTNFEQFFFQSIHIAQTQEALSTIQNNLPQTINFSVSTLLYLSMLCLCFIFFIATTLCKITHQTKPMRLTLKLILLILCTVLLTTLTSDWIENAWLLLLYKALFFSLLLLAILKNHPFILIIKTVFLTLIIQSILNQLFINFYSGSAIYHIIYGQIAGFVILISWVYFSWAIIALVLHLHTRAIQ